MGIHENGPVHAFDDVPDVVGSAILVAEWLSKQLGATASVLVSSIAPRRLLTRGDINTAIDSWLQSAKKMKPEPVLIFYWCGHGVGNPDMNSSYLVPGDVTVSEITAGQNNSLSERVLSVLELAAKIEKSRLRYLILIDACQDDHPGYSRVDLDRFFQQEAKQSLEEILKLVKELNRIRGSDAVIWSSNPGEETAMCENPLLPDGHEVGPICRRLVISLRNSSVSYRRLVEGLVAKDLDSKTIAPVTWYQPAVDDDKLILGQALLGESEGLQ